MSYRKKHILLCWIFITTTSYLQSSDYQASKGIDYQELLEEMGFLPKTATIRLPQKPSTPKPEITTSQYHRLQNALKDITDQEEESAELTSAAVTPTRPMEPKTNQESRDLAIAQIGAGTVFPTVTSWLNAINTLVKNREGAHLVDISAFQLCGDKDAAWLEFKKVLTLWLMMQAKGSLRQKQNWAPTIYNNIMPNNEFFNIDATLDKFQPFAQKIIVPENTVLYMRGDLHGDIFSLAAQLQRLLNEGIIDESFKIINPNDWMIFLGDYVDRGQYGCEVIYTILRLSLANPDQVIAVRGNHEDARLNYMYQFNKEVDRKFDDPQSMKFALINRIYELLPAVLYVGCKDDHSFINYAQCCHGGIEIGYSPSNFLNDDTKKYHLIDRINTLKELEHLSTTVKDSKNESLVDYSPELDAIVNQSKQNVVNPIAQNKTPMNTEDLGFLWNDFDVINNQQISFNTHRQTGLMYGNAATMDALAFQSTGNYKIRWIFRGHQHSCDHLDPMMVGIVESNGIYKLWQPFETSEKRSLHDGVVWTLNVGADSIYGESLNFNFDTYIALQTAKNPLDWKLQVCNQEIINNDPTPLSRTTSLIIDPSFHDDLDSQLTPAEQTDRSFPVLETDESDDDDELEKGLKRIKRSFTLDDFGDIQE